MVKKERQLNMAEEKVHTLHGQLRTVRCPGVVNYPSKLRHNLLYLMYILVICWYCIFQAKVIYGMRRKIGNSMSPKKTKHEKKTKKKSTVGLFLLFVIHIQICMKLYVVQVSSTF